MQISQGNIYTPGNKIPIFWIQQISNLFTKVLGGCFDFCYMLENPVLANLNQCSAGIFEEFDQILVFAHTSAFSSLPFPILTAATEEEGGGTKTFLGKQTRAQKGSRRHYLFSAFYPNSFHK